MRTRLTARRHLVLDVAMAAVMAVGLGGVASTVGVLPASADPNPAGYWFVAGDGGVFSYGPSAVFQGSTGALHLAQPIVGMAPTPDGGGYWLVARDGGIFNFGNAPFLGSTGGVDLAQPIVGMTATPDGDGYWLLGADGDVFPFGTAVRLGSAAGLLNSPAVAIAGSPQGDGYWIIDASGEVVSFGAENFGQRMTTADDPVVGFAPTHGGQGYWVATQAGHVFNFGDAAPLGDPATSVGSLRAPIVGLAATATGGGYYLLGRDGGVFSYGDADFYGSTGGLVLNSPVVGLAVPVRPPGPAHLILRGDDDAAHITVRQDDQIWVELGGCRTCGEGWHLTTPPSAAVLQPGDEEVLGHPTPGAGEEDLFPFTAVDVGSTAAGFATEGTAGVFTFGATVIR